MIKDILHQSLHGAEQIIDRMRGQRDKRRIIEPYIGYATPTHRVIRGRVLATLRRTRGTAGQSRWANMRQMLGLFLTDEVADVPVTAEGVTVTSDEEGYFTLMLPRGIQTGWTTTTVSIKGMDRSADCAVMIADPAADIGVISDIDDTMLQTGAFSLVRNLWTSFTGNVQTRHVFPDAVTFMDTLSDKGRNPIYYVSSSPWNLHHFLSAIFERANLQKGPKFLRDLGIGENQFITGTHGDHKGGSIDTILAANPDLKYVLAGDTGQHDAFVYRDAIKRHPGRIVAIVLREPGPGPDKKSRDAMAEIRAAGVPVYNGRRFDGFAEAILDSVPASSAA